MGNTTYRFDSPTTSNNKRKFKEFTPSIKKLYPEPKKQLLVDLRLSKETSSEIDYTGSTQNYNDSVRYLQQERWKIIYKEITLLEQGRQRQSRAYTTSEYHRHRPAIQQYLTEVARFYRTRHPSVTTNRTQRTELFRQYSHPLNRTSDYGNFIPWSTTNITKLAYQNQGLRVGDPEGETHYNRAHWTKALRDCEEDEDKVITHLLEKKVTLQDYTKQRILDVNLARQNHQGGILSYLQKREIGGQVKRYYHIPDNEGNKDGQRQP